MADFEKAIPHVLKKKCSVDWCNAPSLSRGLCNAHYLRLKNGSDMDKPIRVENPDQGCKVHNCADKHYGLGCCKKHYKSEQRKQRWEYIIQIKGGGCQRCGVSYHYSVYDLHHREPDKKEFSIGSDMCNISMEALLEEVEKCDLLCSNCHRLTHFTYGEF